MAHPPQAEASEASQSQLLDLLGDDEEALSFICEVVQQRPQLASSLAQWLIPDFAFAPSKAITENRSRGHIKLFDAQKGFGFIACPEIKEAFGCDVWLHHSQVGQFEVGNEVSFAVLLNKECKPQAFDLTSPELDGNSQHGSAAVAPSQLWQGSQHGIASAAPSQLWQGKGKGLSASGGCSTGTVSKGNASSLGKGSDIVPWVPAGSQVAQRFTGTIKSFVPEKGFGFIACDQLMQQYGRDVWLHSAVIGSFQVGDTVSFTYVLNKDGHPQAEALFPMMQGNAAKGGVKGKGALQGSPIQASAPQAADGAPTGKIKSFFAEKGYGFIDCPAIFAVFGRDTWVHHEQLVGFNVGDVVSFTQVLNKDGAPQAIDLRSPNGKGARKDVHIAAAAQMGGPRFVGSVKSIFPEKGFGFIDCAALYAQFGRDTWVSCEQLGGFAVGETVSFQQVLGKEGHPQAIDVQKGSGKGQGRPMDTAAMHTYLPASQSVTKRFTGVIKSIFPEKGFGFIDCPQLHAQFGRDTWVHHEQVGSFGPGDSVSFETVLNKDGHPQAINLLKAMGKTGMKRPFDWI